MLSAKQKKIASKAGNPNKIDAKDFAVLKAEKAKGRGMGLQDEQLPPGKMVKANIGKMIEDGVAGMAAAESMSPDDRVTQTDMDYAEARSKPLPALQEYKRKPMTPKERREQDIAKRSQKKMGGGMVDPTLANYQKGGSVQARGVKLARTRPTKLY